MQYDDITDTLHGDYCRFLESPGDRKQVTMPRSFVKTWIGSIAFPVWVTLDRQEEDEFPYDKAWEDKFWTLGPNMRVLVASYVISNAEKMIGLKRKTYESNSAMQILFPEVIPTNFNKTRWSNQSACINRNENFTESTFEAAGIGGASTSRHYDLIIEDDLIYAKKDDMSEQELQPNQDDIDKAIGWHKLVTSLLVPGKHTRIINTGTRWAKHDLVDYIWRNEPDYKRFIRGAVDLEELKSGKPWNQCAPEWHECYDIEQLEKIAKAQGPYMFATQYLLNPMSPQEMIMQKKWLQFYISSSDIPKNCRRFTTIDLSGWGKDKRSKTSRGVVLTCGWDERSHGWIMHYDVGKFNPTQIIILMAKHWRLFKPEYIAVEEVYYQEALSHFARKAMEAGFVINENGEKVSIPWMSIKALKPGNVKKELRIRAIEPIASNLGLHCKESHTEFIEEFVEYIPNNDICTKDILDALAYQIQVARPGEVESEFKREGEREFVAVGKVDDFLKWAWGKNNPKDRFGNEGTPTNPFGEESPEEVLANVTDPFGAEDIYDEDYSYFQ